MKCNGKLETTVFCEENNNDIYLQWRSFAPMKWKKVTLRKLIRRALQFVRMIIFCGKNYTI